MPMPPSVASDNSKLSEVNGGKRAQHGCGLLQNKLTLFIMPLFALGDFRDVPNIDVQRTSRSLQEPPAVHIRLL